MMDEDGTHFTLAQALTIDPPVQSTSEYEQTHTLTVLQSSQPYEASLAELLRSNLAMQSAVTASLEEINKSLDFVRNVQIELRRRMQASSNATDCSNLSYHKRLARFVPYFTKTRAMRNPDELTMLRSPCEYDSGQLPPCRKRYTIIDEMCMHVNVVTQLLQQRENLPENVQTLVNEYTTAATESAMDGQRHPESTDEYEIDHQQKLALLNSILVVMPACEVATFVDWPTIALAIQRPMHLRSLSVAKRNPHAIDIKLHFINCAAGRLRRNMSPKKYKYPNKVNPMDSSLRLAIESLNLNGLPRGLDWDRLSADVFLRKYSTFECFETYMSREMEVDLGLFTKELGQLLVKLHKSLKGDWNLIADAMPGLWGRRKLRKYYEYHLQPGLRFGMWSDLETRTLLRLVARVKAENAKSGKVRLNFGPISRMLGNGRTAKQCHCRYEYVSSIRNTKKKSRKKAYATSYLKKFWKKKSSHISNLDRAPLETKLNDPNLAEEYMDELLLSRMTELHGDAITAAQTFSIDVLRGGSKRGVVMPPTVVTLDAYALLLSQTSHLSECYARAHEQVAEDSESFDTASLLDSAPSNAASTELTKAFVDNKDYMSFRNHAKSLFTWPVLLSSFKDAAGDHDSKMDID